MTKRLLSLLFTLVVTLGAMFLVNVKTSAAYNYDVEKALEYAEDNWDSGVGLCAEYVSKCLNAGGVDVSNIRVCTLYDELLDKGYGKSYKLNLTNGRSGAIRMSDNEGKVSVGDPIFYYCNSCNDFQHVVLCNGANSNGYIQDYAHNNAHNGYKQTYTYRHSCGSENWTFYSIKMHNAETLFGKQTSVDAPKITKVSNTGEGINIEWNTVEKAGFYQVYRKQADGKWSILKKVKDNSFVDTTAENGKEYTYTVRAGKGAVVSAYYAGETIKCLSQVDFKSISNSKNGIVLSWEENNLGDGYRIYRKVNNGKWSTYKKINSNVTTKLVDKNIKSGNTYSYRVRVTAESVLSSYDYKGVQSKFLATPKLTNARNTINGVAFNWDNVKGATGYKVYRKADSDKKWRYIGFVTENSYIDSNVQSGVCYRYTVKAANDEIVSGYDSKGVLIKCLSTPELVSADVIEKGISFTWNGVTGSEGYYVYRKTGNSKSWKRVATVKKKTNYVDSNVKEDKTYKYTVRAFCEDTVSGYNSKGVESK